MLGGSFYSTRLSIALRKQSGLVYSVDSTLEAGKTRSAYLVEYACDPPNVVKAAAIVRREIADMQRTPVGKEELLRVKELLVRQIPLGGIERGCDRGRHHQPGRPRPAAR